MDEKELKEEKNCKLYFVLIAVLLIVLLVISISVVSVTFTKKGDKINTITTGNISLDFSEDTNANISELESIKNELAYERENSEKFKNQLEEYKEKNVSMEIDMEILKDELKKAKDELEILFS